MEEDTNGCRKKIWKEAFFSDRDARCHIVHATPDIERSRVMTRAYLVWEGILAESNISMNPENLEVPFIRWCKFLTGSDAFRTTERTRSLTGSSGIVVSFSTILVLKLSTKLSKSFFAAR